nr:4Fe-4S binding protein [Desulfobulbaceae bacterium]
MDFLRKWVQTIFFVLTNGSWSFPFTRTIYQGPLKVVCSPGLNCYSCPAATTYCPMGSLQQILAGIRLALENGQMFFGFYVIGTIGVIGGFVGRMVCGWICPFGLFQELLHKIPSPKFNVPRVLRFIKYGVLALMVVVLPLFAVDQFGLGSPWFCKYLCPAGTLEAGLPMLALQPALRQTIGPLFYNKLFFMFVFVLWSIPASRPFCRTTCPLGAFYALFSKVKLVKLRLDENRCTQCKACHTVCPMGVKFNESPEDMECISCLSCTKACKFGAIELEIGGVPINSVIKVKKPLSEKAYL